MSKQADYLTRNARRFLMAEFSWNFARTLPHAVLTIYLLNSGISLAKIAILQSVFMIAAMVTEFPSGILADRYSRKSLYLISIVLILVSYVLMGFFSSHFIILFTAYILYGLSMALKSGTLDADIVLECRENQLDVRHFSVANSYIMSFSSLFGGFLGSVFYSFYKNKVYIISIICFFAAFMIGSTCYVAKQRIEERIRENKSLKSELKEGIELIRGHAQLRTLILLFALTALFLQPFFQYWQVLYKSKGVPVALFGTIYVLFQLCNIAASFMYKKIKESYLVYGGIIIAIPAAFILSSFFQNGLVIVFPVVVFLFYIYNQHLDVVRKKISPSGHISAYFSLIGTVENVASMISLFLMALAIEHWGIQWAYSILFVIFAVLTIVLSYKQRGSMYHCSHQSGV